MANILWVEAFRETNKFSQIRRSWQFYTKLLLKAFEKFPATKKLLPVRTALTITDLLVLHCTPKLFCHCMRLLRPLYSCILLILVKSPNVRIAQSVTQWLYVFCCWKFWCQYCRKLLIVSYLPKTRKLGNWTYFPTLIFIQENNSLEI